MYKKIDWEGNKELTDRVTAYINTGCRLEQEARYLARSIAKFEQDQPNQEQRITAVKVAQRQVHMA